VDWGDGSAPHQSTPGRDAFSVSHRYAKAGTYTVRAIWTDSTGQSNFRDLRITVKAPKHTPRKQASLASDASVPTPPRAL
jgi:hypothetical protein